MKCVNDYNNFWEKLSKYYPISKGELRLPIATSIINLNKIIKSEEIEGTPILNIDEVLPSEKKEYVVEVTPSMKKEDLLALKEFLFTQAQGEVQVFINFK